MTRRCLICANLNPCRQHTEREQMAELRRNDAAVAAIPSTEPARPLYAVTPMPNGRWLVSNMNGRGRVHGVEVIDNFETKEAADAHVSKLLGAAP